MKRVILAALLFVGYACTTTAPPPQPPETMQGIASWYGQEFAGRTTANGEIFDPLLLTAAHRSLPFGTVVDVMNPATSQTVRVRINDRGPYVGKRVIDLSFAAAQKIGLVEPGSGNVMMTVVRIGKGEREPPAPYSVIVAGQPATASPASSDVPPVDFPLPSAVGSTTTTTPVASNEVTVDRIEVVEVHGGKETHRQVAADGKTIANIPVIAPVPVETRRQVAADGKSIEAVPVDGNGVQAGQGKPDPLAALERVRATLSAPGHSAAARLDASAQRNGAGATSSRALSRFVVQVGAFADEKNALALQSQLRQAGFDSHIDDHAPLHRVQMGPFDKREQAIKIRERLEVAGLSAMIVSAQ